MVLFDGGNGDDGIASLLVSDAVGDDAGDDPIASDDVGVSIARGEDTPLLSVSLWRRLDETTATGCTGGDDGVERG